MRRVGDVAPASPAIAATVNVSVTYAGTALGVDAPSDRNEVRGPQELDLFYGFFSPRVVFVSIVAESTPPFTQRERLGY